MLNHCFEGFCEHKDLLPLASREIMGIVFVAIFACISSAIGSGGGILYLPVLLQILQFETHQAIGMSALLVFFCSLPRLFKHLRMKHPSRDSPAIDYTLCLTLLPALMIGATVGIFLARILSCFILQILLAFITGLYIYITYGKARKLYQIEKEFKNLILSHSQMKLSIGSIYAIKTSSNKKNSSSNQIFKGLRMTSSISNRDLSKNEDSWLSLISKLPKHFQNIDSSISEISMTNISRRNSISEAPQIPFAEEAIVNGKRGFQQLLYEKIKYQESLY